MVHCHKLSVWYIQSNITWITRLSHPEIVGSYRMLLILPWNTRAEKSTGWEWGKKCHALAPEHKPKVCTSFPEGEQCSAVQGSLRKVLTSPFSHWQGLWEIKKDSAWLCNGLFGWCTGSRDFFFREKPYHGKYVFFKSNLRCVSLWNGRRKWERLESC